VEVVDGAAQDLRKKNPDSVIEEDAEPAPDETAAVALEIRSERSESLQHHDLGKLDLRKFDSQERDTRENGFL